MKDYGIDSGDKEETADAGHRVLLEHGRWQITGLPRERRRRRKETFKGYAKDIRDLNARDQELKLAGIQMGLSEKGKADATRQAINLKKIEVVGDTKELLSLADKSKQVDYLVRVGKVTKRRHRSRIRWQRQEAGFRVGMLVCLQEEFLPSWRHRLQETASTGGGLET